MPTGYTPIYRVMKGGLDITDKFNDRTTSIKVELIAGGGDGDHCQIKLDDRDWAIAAVDPGENLSIWLGYQEVGLAYMGSFEIDDVTYLGMPRSIQLTGLSTGMRDIQKAPQIKDFDNKSVGDILGQMAGQTGLGVSIGSGIGGNKIPFKNQVVSNLHLIHEMERIYGAVAKVVDGKLMFVPRDSTESASGLPIPTLVLLPEHFGTWNVRYSSKTEYGGTKAAWFDKDEMVRKWVNAGASAASGGGEGAGPYALGQLFNSQAEAEAAAKSKMEALKRAEVQAVFDLAKGDPWVRDMQTILVSGMRDKVNGSYVIEKATHTYIKTTGIRSTLECRAPGDGADYSDRATDEFLRPGPGELMGEVINGQFQGMPTQDQPM